jgi:hypothetical protein
MDTKGTTQTKAQSQQPTLPTAAIEVPVATGETLPPGVADAPGTSQPVAACCGPQKQQSCIGKVEIAEL